MESYLSALAIGDSGPLLLHFYPFSPLTPPVIIWSKSQASKIKF